VDHGFADYLHFSWRPEEVMLRQKPSGKRQDEAGRLLALPTIRWADSTLKTVEQRGSVPGCCISLHPVNRQIKQVEVFPFDDNRAVAVSRQLAWVSTELLEVDRYGSPRLLGT
jgi:hypothetical protein